MDSIFYTLHQELNALSCMADNAEGCPDLDATGGNLWGTRFEGEELPYLGWLIPFRWRRSDARGGAEGN